MNDLSEEVRKVVAVLEDYIGDDALETPLYEAIEKAMFMIERLAREAKVSNGAYETLFEISLLQAQRIKELEDRFMLAKDQLRRAEAQRDDAFLFMQRQTIQSRGWSAHELAEAAENELARIRAMGEE